MNDFFNLANKKIGKLISELSDDAKKFIENTKSEEEQGKITLILLYYKLIFQGAINFGLDMHGFVKIIKDCAMDESDISLVLDKYCEKNINSTIISDMELYETPYIDVDIKPANGLNDIKLDEDLDIKIEMPDDTKMGKISSSTEKKGEHLDFDISNIFEEFSGELNKEANSKKNFKETKNVKNISINNDKNSDSDLMDLRGRASIKSNNTLKKELADVSEMDPTEENYSALFESLRLDELENMQKSKFDFEINKDE